MSCRWRKSNNSHFLPTMRHSLSSYENRVRIRWNFPASMKIIRWLTGNDEPQKPWLTAGGNFLIFRLCDTRLCKPCRPDESTTRLSFWTIPKFVLRFT